MKKQKALWAMYSVFFLVSVPSEHWNDVTLIHWAYSQLFWKQFQVVPKMYCSLLYSRTAFLCCCIDNKFLRYSQKKVFNFFLFNQITPHFLCVENSSDLVIVLLKKSFFKILRFLFLNIIFYTPPPINVKNRRLENNFVPFTFSLFTFKNSSRPSGWHFSHIPTKILLTDTLSSWEYVEAFIQHFMAGTSNFMYVSLQIPGKIFYNISAAPNRANKISSDVLTAAVIVVLLYEFLTYNNFQHNQCRI